MMMIMMGGGWSSREAERDSRERGTGESGEWRPERRRGGLLLSVAVLESRWVGGAEGKISGIS